MEIPQKTEEKDRETENQKFKYTKGVSVGETSENGEEGIISKLMQETFSALRP